MANAALRGRTSGFCLFFEEDTSYFSTVQYAMLVVGCIFGFLAPALPIQHRQPRVRYMCSERWARSDLVDCERHKGVDATRYGYAYCIGQRGALHAAPRSRWLVYEARWRLSRTRWLAMLACGSSNALVARTHTHTHTVSRSFFGESWLSSAQY